MNKRKILALSMSLCMVAILAVGGTLAYFTSQETATNVFTYGNVKIDLVEEERVFDEETQEYKPGELAEFKNDKVLLPIVGDAQTDAKFNITDEKGTYSYELPPYQEAKNYIDKIVTVDNEGNLDAYVRVLVAFPVKMENGANSNDDLIMHWNLDGQEDSGWECVYAGVDYTDADGEEYSVYEILYTYVVEPGKSTKSPAVTGLYLDKDVDVTVDENNNTIFTNKRTGGTASYAQNTYPKMLVVAQGVQADGFTTSRAAMDAAFPLNQTNVNTWFDGFTADQREDI